MIIPIRCFTCGKVLADKWIAFSERCSMLELCPEEKTAAQRDGDGTPHNFDGCRRGKVLDELGLTRICCRRHMLGHVDLLDDI